MTQIAIVDYGCGNLASIQNMLRKIGCESSITDQADDIEDAQAVILPGVGAFDEGMSNLHELALVGPLLEYANTGKSILGICLGAQLICRSSEEGIQPGLGLIDATVNRFDADRLGERDRIPNMGWLDVEYHHADPLFQGYNEEPRFYFVHSYHINCSDQLARATAKHGYRFVAAVRDKNIAGVQFHPEKSHKFGMQLFRNFVAGVETT